MEVRIDFHQTWQNAFLQRLERDGPWSNWEIYQLALEAEQHTFVSDFDNLQSLKFLPELKPLPHQLEAVKQVIENMNGKAILADEVGLGKTIEAGLILKEYMIRGLVKKVLILVPASLISQWVLELNKKFYIPAVPYKKSWGWKDQDIIVSSLDTAKRSPHAEMILEQNYDFIIIDEAHKLKNAQTKNYQFVQRLKKKFCLLLTATPIQNKVEEIFHLVSLLKPGHLGSSSNFLKKYKGSHRKEIDDGLKDLIRKVMVRQSRRETNIQWTKRHVETVIINFTPKEREFYEMIIKFPKKEAIFDNAFSLLTLKREACSSKEAVFFTLKNMLKKQNPPSPALVDFTNQLIKKMEGITVNSKAEKALDLIRKIDDKVIIFTEYRATQLYLQWFFQKHGIRSVPFRGGFKRGKKDWMKELFQTSAQVFISTEAGGEGINLQFCNHMINFDLPWNPMKLEQRIGRIHRLGQQKDVFIYNFAVKNTVEEQILKLLYEKINLFERVIGELDEILTKLNVGTLHEHLTDIFATSESEGEMKIKMDNFTSVIELAQSLKGDELDAATGNSSIS
ncbi:DEAD/DEAH box helicase [Fervidibacillus halotolerans]|uniref:DEAD/DEAH box helicase n=1 Tax=Fervidibacillus halotolerans TaxID=2980027 RepID=A0A9E8LYP9_9BACI|nr:SNF2-related protein [Fervidibacillus halotolerans]WAA11441.1 DEAD/DEAH box helicase [Fervidibacillus halotolerans]